MLLKIKQTTNFLSRWCVTSTNMFFFINLICTSLQISILSVAETVRSCSLDQCYKSLLSPATSETKRKMSTFISNIKASDGATQHAVGFQKAFQLLRNTSSLCKHSTSKKTILWRHCILRMCTVVLCATLVINSISCAAIDMSFAFVSVFYQPQTW